MSLKRKRDDSDDKKVNAKQQKTRGFGWNKSHANIFHVGREPGDNSLKPIISPDCVKINSLICPPIKDSNVNSYTRNAVPAALPAAEWKDTVKMMLKKCATDMKALERLYSVRIDEDIQLRKGIPIMSGVRIQGQRHIPGHYRARRFLQAMDMLKMHKYGPQQHIIRTAFEALLPQLYGDDFEVWKDWIAKEYGVSDFRGEIVGTYPRRKGKTMSLAAIEVCAQFAMDGTSSKIYAAVAQQSRAVMDQVALFMEDLPGGRQMIVSHTDKRLKISKIGIKSDPNCGNVYAFSGNVNSGRGGKGVRFYGDEAMAMKSAQIEVNFLPGMMMRHSLCILLSSPSDNSSHTFFKMCQMRSMDGQYRLRRLNPSFDKCKECKIAKIMTCKHKQARPPWETSDARYQLLRDIAGEINEHRAQVEFDGKTDDASEVQVFHHEDTIQLLHDGVVFANPISTVAIAIDTSGGGHGSDTSVFAFTVDSEGRFVMLGIDTIPMDGIEPQTQAVIDFVDQLRTRPSMKASTMLLIVEANYGGQQAAGAIYREVVANCQPCVSMMTKRAGRYQPGVWITHDVKEAAVWATKDLFKKRQIVPCKDIVSLHNHKPVQELIKQLLRFQRRYDFDVEKNKTVHKNPYYYSGKAPGEKDDMVLSFIEGLYYYNLFLKVAEYRAESKRYTELVMASIGGRLVSSRPHPDSMW